ncbi:hypothetical protein EDB81DRAFT_479378 [Dactylonectria macrodidyma]|uniref:Uncharacterized protein n=1 Tax=Dactylonectria macrodidyma TaxID=307937 RepID=A0A9P9EZ50_9HYPO|nr:hypothetical protein EDB81DRAFT_479378 [Dactylonectria macrodidyma]
MASGDISLNHPDNSTRHAAASPNKLPGGGTLEGAEVRTRQREGQTAKLLVTPAGRGLQCSVSEERVAAESDTTPSSPLQVQLESVGVAAVSRLLNLAETPRRGLLVGSPAGIVEEARRTQQRPSAPIQTRNRLLAAQGYQNISSALPWALGLGSWGLTKNLKAGNAMVGAQAPSPPAVSVVGAANEAANREKVVGRVCVSALGRFGGASIPQDKYPMSRQSITTTRGVELLVDSTNSLFPRQLLSKDL